MMHSNSWDANEREVVIRPLCICIYITQHQRKITRTLLAGMVVSGGLQFGQALF